MKFNVYVCINGNVNQCGWCMKCWNVFYVWTCLEIGIESMVYWLMLQLEIEWFNDITCMIDSLKKGLTWIWINWNETKAKNGKF